MADSLRRRVIRLAHERPDLRPHLLPLLRESRDAGLSRKGYVRVPSDAYSLGFEGPDAEAKAAMIRAAVLGAVKKVREHWVNTFQDLSARLRTCAAVDKNPGVSRTYLGLSMEDTYKEISDDAVNQFERVR